MKRKIAGTLLVIFFYLIFTKLLDYLDTYFSISQKMNFIYLIIIVAVIVPLSILLGIKLTNSNRKKLAGILLSIVFFIMFLKMIDYFGSYFPFTPATDIIYLFSIVVVIIPASIILGLKLTDSNGE